MKVTVFNGSPAGCNSATNVIVSFQNQLEAIGKCSCVIKKYVT